MKKISLILAVVAMFSACGGGGGNSAPVPVVTIDPNMTVPIQTAVANLVNNGVNKPFTVTGSADHSTLSTKVPLTQITGSGNLAAGAPTAATFNGDPALQSTQVVTGSLTAGGQSIPIATSSNVFYNTVTYATLGAMAGGVTTINSPYAYPATVKAGSAGSLGSGTTGGFAADTSTTTYSVASDTATSLLVTVSQDTNNSGGGATKTQTVHRITTSGDISLMSISTQLAFLGATYQSLIFTF